MRQKCCYLVWSFGCLLGWLLLVVLLPSQLLAQNTSQSGAQGNAQAAAQEVDSQTTSQAEAGETGKEIPRAENKPKGNLTDASRKWDPRFQTKPKVVLGFGINIAYTILSDEGKDSYEALSDTGFNKQSFFSFGGVLPFAMTFRVVGPWRLGFGAYAMLSYQSAKARMLEKFPERGVQDITYGRGAADFSLVFYNEFILSRFFSLNVAVGPSFTLTFADNSRKSQNGEAIPDPFTTFERKDPLQYEFGIMVDLGLQVRFSYTVGIGIDSFLLMYFNPQKTAFDANTWNEKTTYAGTLGASVTLLFFL